MDWLSVLRAIAPKGKADILRKTAEAMPDIVKEFDLTTKLRQAHFLAQLAHECDGFKTTREYWGPTDAQRRYEGRRDLGNTEPGDGRRYMGRGLIQLTGRANYREASKALGVDFESNPVLAEQFPHAIRIAGWYWKTRKINQLADADNLNAVTRRVNGGLNGIADRERYLRLAKAALDKREIAARIPPPPDVPAPEPVEKPWWERSPVLRSIGQAVAWLGAGGTAILTADWKVVAVLSVVGLALAIMALRYQVKVK